MDGATRPGPPQGERLTTGVAGLDAVLGGGLPRRALALVVGPPGAGKTVLAMQFALHRARRGERCLFFTALSESHERLFAAMRAFAFHDPALEGELVQVLSLLGSLEDGGLDAAGEAIVRTARAQRAGVVVVDGFGGLAGFAAVPAAVPRFLARLRGLLALLGCTLLVTEVEGEAAPDRALLTVADVIVRLRHEAGPWAARRALRVQKLRTGAQRDGWHAFAIGADGIACFPRQETVPADPASAPPAGRAGFGLAALDDMLGGGPPAGSATLLCGAVGTGKTLLALHYLLEGARRGEPGVLVGFHEDAAALVAKAAAFGLDLGGALAGGRVALLWRTPAELEADRTAAELRAAVAATGARRVVVDTVGDLEAALGDPGRAPGFFAALLAWLHGRGVATLGCSEVAQLVGPELDFRASPLVALADNVLLLRHLEDRGALRRLVVALEMRGSAYDSAIREFVLDPAGVRVLPAPEATEGLLTGVARRVGGAPPAR